MLSPMERLLLLQPLALTFLVSYNPVAWLRIFVSHAAAEAPRLTLISADASVLAGETVILACVGSARFLTWSFNGQAIQNSSLSTIYEERTIENGRAYIRSLLQLCGVSSSYSGTYTCSVRNEITVNATTQVTVSGQCSYSCIVAIS